MSITFSLDTDINPTTINVPVTLNISIPPDSIDSGIVGIIYHECTVAETSGFFKIQHEPSEVPPTDDDDYIKFVFDTSVLTTMLGDIKEWHIQARGATDSSNKGYYNQQPDSAIPNQDDPDISGDVDNAVYYQDTDAIESEPKYPFKFKILPMRVYAAFGANITDLITMETFHYNIIQSKINQSKTNIIDTFTTASGKDYNENTDANIGRKLWGQAQYLMSMELINGNSTLATRIINMFHSSSTITTSTTTDDNGQTINIQTTEFLFAEGDEIQFLIKFTAGAISIPDMSSVGHNEPSEYKFKARLRIKA
tara:strand:+ start:5824 stop:6753 length:930 start_codon:yes stop_codon:yes gene_type:complete